MKRIVHALAALAMFAVASLVWASPAHAAPSGPCSVEELQNPANFADCARRARESLVEAAGCVSAPSPGSPLSGMAGWFASEPDSAKRDGVHGMFSRYGVGGYGLDTYNLGCLGTVTHPDLTGWNAAASGEFGFAAAILGAANQLRERAYDPGSMFAGWSDPFIEKSTQAIYTTVFSPFGAIALAGLGLFMIWTARHGRLSQTVKMSAWAIFLLVAVTAVARWPINSVHAADQVGTTGLAAVHSVLGPGRQDTPAGQCMLGGDACKDNRSVATRASDVATETILYRYWVRAVLGTADSDTARMYGPALYDATAMEWGEAERAGQSPQLRNQLIKLKADNWNTFAMKIQADDPVAYSHLQGEHGFDRFGAGFLALGSAAVFSAFDITASVIILFGFGIIRLAVPLLPLLAVPALFYPFSGLVRRLFNAVIAALFNIVIFGAVAGLYLSIADAVFRSVLPGPAQIIIVAITGLVAFLLTHPVRQIVSTVSGRSRAKDGPLSRAFQHGKRMVLDRTSEQTASADDDAAVPARPEGDTQPPVSKRDIALDVVAPSLRDAGSHPAVAATLDAARNRPEGDAGFGTKLRYAANTVATVAATAAGGPAAGAATVAVTNRPAERAETRS